MNREDWLTTAALEVAPLLEMAGHPLPKVRITCGFPSTFRRSGTLGECWSDKASGDGTFEILISLTVADAAHVFAVLLAQLCAASKANPVGLGLDADGALSDGRWLALINEMGAYPHSALTVGEKPVQTTRMLKAVCPDCKPDSKYHVRLTAKWARVGLPLCPVHKVSMVLEASV